MKKKRTCAKALLPNIKHIGEVPKTRNEYRKLFNYIAFAHNNTCYHCGKKHKTTRGFVNNYKREMCLHFIDDSCIDLRDENLAVICWDRTACDKRIIYRNL